MLYDGLVRSGGGYWRLKNIPTQTDLNTFYQEQYYQRDHRKQLAKERREWWYWEMVYGQRLKQFEVFGTDRDVLDYGAGFGWFARAARKRGRFVSVMEPSAVASVHLGKLGFRVTTNRHPLEYGSIHCSLVLEHVLDPLSELRRLRWQLRHNGVICVVVPNEFNRYQQALSHRYGYTPVHREHVNYFTQDTIKSLMEDAGFHVLYQENTFPMERFALTTPLNYVRWPRLGPVAHWARMLYEAIIPGVALHEKRRQWAKRRVGRETITWGRK